MTKDQEIEMLRNALEHVREAAEHAGAERTDAKERLPFVQGYISLLAQMALEGSWRVRPFERKVA